MFEPQLSRRLARTLRFADTAEEYRKQVRYIAALNDAERDGCRVFDDLPVALQQQVRARER